MAKVPVGTLWLRTADSVPKKKYLEVRCLLGPEAIKPIDGYAKWQVIDRPKKRGLTEWIGTNPLKISISFIIDYLSDPDKNPGMQCEDDIRTIERMAGLDAAGAVKPPQLIWDANGPHDYSEATQTTWVITSIDWGDPMYLSSGNRIRQGGTLELTQYVADEFISVDGVKKNKKKTGNDKDGPSKHRYKVKTSDKNLKEIAQREMGNANLWTKIAKLNKLRGPNRTKKWPKYLWIPGADS